MYVHHNLPFFTYITLLGLMMVSIFIWIVWRNFGHRSDMSQLRLMIHKTQPKDACVFISAVVNKKYATYSHWIVLDLSYDQSIAQYLLHCPIHVHTASSPHEYNLSVISHTSQFIDIAWRATCGFRNPVAQLVYHFRVGWKSIGYV